MTINLKKILIGGAIIGLVVTPYILEGRRASRYEEIKKAIEQYSSANKSFLKKGQTYWTPAFEIQEKLRERGIDIKDPSIICQYLEEKFGKRE